MSDTFDHEADAWDSLLFNDEPDEYPGWQNKISATCKFCKAEGLRWTQREGKWRLAYSDGRLHGCVEYSAVQKLRQAREQFQ